MRFVTAVFAVLLLAPLAAEDWPQFRGPTGQGHADDATLPLQWSETENIAWKTAIPGSGWSSPAVANGRVWITAARDVGRDVSLRALAFDAGSGRLVVDAEVFRIGRSGPLHQKNSRASPTPIVDGQRVYVHFGPDGTAALDWNGRVLWTRKLSYEPQHGGGGSPALYRDLLIVNCDGNGDEAYVVALDTRTGAIRWRTDRRRPSAQAYTTPLIVNDGARDLAISVGAFRTSAYDPLTGTEIWRVSYADGFSNVPRPVFAHGLVYLVTGFNTPAVMAVRTGGRGDVTRSHVAWTATRGAPYTPSPILVGQQFYMVSDTGVLTAMEAVSGKLLWQQRLGGNYSASPVHAAGRIFFLSEEGVTTAIAAGGDFKRLAVSTLDDVTLASMAPSDGAWYVRGQQNLYKIQARAGGAGSLPGPAPK